MSAGSGSRQFAAGNGNGHMTRVERSPELVQRMRHVVKAGGQRVDLDEIGTSGLRHYGGFVLEEWLRQLQGSRAAWVYREMADNDPVIGAILFAIEMLARNAEWTVKQGKDADSAEFVESCMGDMSHTWDDLVSEALSMLSYGWAYHEIVYKRRQGQQAELPMDQAEAQNAPEDVASSAFDDGRIGWRKIPVRAQETLLRWTFDLKGGTQAMQQVDYQGHYHIIPIQKALLFRPRARRGNPEGRSLLRNAFVPWYRLKNIQEIEAIGIERDLAGLPVATPPPGVDLFAAQNEKLLAEVQKLVTTIRRDEDEGVVLPQAEWKLELLTTGGSRQIDTDAIVRRYEQRIASSVLADFILIGQDSVGSYAMVDVKSDVFAIALDTILDMVADVVNRYSIPRLLRLNGLPLDDPPQVAHGSTGRVDLQRIATFLEMLSTAGAPIPWSKTLIETLFQEAGIPAEFDEAAVQAPEKAPAENAPAPGDDKQPGTQPAGEQDGKPDDKNPALPDWALPGSVKPLAKAAASTGAMVALYPTADVAQALCQDGGEPADELHLTLAFLGPAAAITDPQELRQAVALWAARTPPLQGEISGTGKFTAGPQPVSYASADVPGLPAARQRLVDALERTESPASREHGFTPHITLAYADQDPAVENHPLSFEKATLKLGDQRHDFPLAGVRKAEDLRSDVHPVVHRLHENAGQLERSMSLRVGRALDELGRNAQAAYLGAVTKADASKNRSKNPSNLEPTRADRSLVERVMKALNLPEWVAGLLKPIFHRHYQRVLADTVQTINTQIGLRVNIPDPLARQIVAEGGSRVALLDVEQTVRDAIFKAIAEGRARGEGPQQIARQIRALVPAGRFVHAGSAYRARLIATNETLHAQRMSQLAAYEQAPSVTAVRVHDGIFGEPRSDEACIGRDGEEISIEDARAHVQELHPQCTLSFSPVIGTPTQAPEPQPSGAAAEPVPA